MTTCGHEFHTLCLDIWRKATKVPTCPMCRSYDISGLVTTPTGKPLFGQEADGDILMADSEFDLVAWAISSRKALREEGKIDR